MHNESSVSKIGTEDFFFIVPYLKLTVSTGCRSRLVVYENGSMCFFAFTFAISRIYLNNIWIKVPVFVLSFAVSGHNIAWRRVVII